LFLSKPIPQLLTGTTMTDFPSYELVQRLMHESGFPVADPNDEMVFPEAKFMKLASRLIQYGADQELEACCEWLQDPDLNVDTYKLRNARRPKPPSLKEKALEALGPEPLPKTGPRGDIILNAGTIERHRLVRKALEALPND
jgi:hypothetical protein